MLTQKNGPRKISYRKWSIIGFIIALASARILYGVLDWRGLNQSSALFVGVPALIAIILVLTPKSKSCTGTIMKGMTIALAAATVLVPEGIICIVLAAPLFYIVGLVIGITADLIRRSSHGQQDKRLQGLIILPFMLISFEGVHESLSFPREEMVTVEKVVQATPQEVEMTLSQVADYDQNLPFFFRLGFPAPIASSGGGLELGDQRSVQFSDGHLSPGTLFIEVIDRSSNSVRFRTVSDSSEIARWLEWGEAEVSWVGGKNGETLVTLEQHYKRLLDPAWYFGPLEKLIVRVASGHVIDALATPRGEFLPSG